MDPWFQHLRSASDRLADEVERARYLIRHGSMRAGLYAPCEDDQQPHSQDELYIVHSGTAVFHRDNAVVDVEPGNLIFVPAGTVHRFDQMSDDFATIVVFWGPQNGESDQ